ncbi:MAG TPA: hypothetical protein VFT74_19250 [Isosphaeraceae bacterium]|nr:hypothetical protein [Isosphaeraceae bacterium]
MKPIPIQPIPIRTRVARISLGGQVATAVMRHWRPGDTARCQLCRNCSARDNGCLVLIGLNVAPNNAALLNTIEIERPCSSPTLRIHGADA